MAIGRYRLVNNYWIIVLLIISLTFSCRKNTSKQAPNSLVDVSQIQNGDIICRLGTGIFSDYFRLTSVKEKRYSHIGIVCLDDQEINVIHSEASEFTGVGGVMKESIAEFLQNVSCWGVYRLDTIQNVRDSIAIKALSLFAAKISFDMNFDNSSDDRLYCSELVAKCINNAVCQDLIKPMGVFNKINYYAVDDIYLSEKMKLIISSN